MNSGISPLDLGKNQTALNLNCSVRKGYLHNRPPYQKRTLNFLGDTELETLVLTGNYQGGGYYRPDYGTESLIAQIAGHLILFTETSLGYWAVTDISIADDLNDPTVKQVWMWQSEKWMIISDGSGALPIFYDGTTSRRSYGGQVELGTTSAPFTPPAIGSSAQMTLVAPYTGEFNIPVLFNGEFYQPLYTSSSQQTVTYQATLKNISATAGGTIPIGTNISIIPANLSVLGVASTVSGASGTTTLFGVPLLTPDLTGKTISITPTSGTAKSFKFLSVSSQTATLTYYIAKLLQDISAPKTFAAGAVVVDSGNSSPTVVVATNSAAFTIPAIGSTVTPVSISAPYTGAANQLVWILGQMYQITAIATPPADPTNLLTILNLTDTQTTAVISGTKLYSVPELPAGRMGAYGMARNAMCLVSGLSYIMGDIAGGAAGTAANDYRDSVLKTTENDDLPGGGAFSLPGSGDIITAMIYTTKLDKSLGQGGLQIF
jgi:hypothetical protein